MKSTTTFTPISWNLGGKIQGNSNIVIGVLALQGDFLEHIQVLERIGITAKEVRLPSALKNIDGIILPGGESTTIARLLDVFDLREPLQKKITEGMPVWGTCAGMILLAKKLIQEKPAPLGVMDIVIDRNAYGRQIDSFEIDVSIKQLGEKALQVAFIRAPKIEQIGKDVEVLATLEDGTIVAIKQNNILATAFHPELGGDIRFHEYFVSLTEQNKKQFTK